MYLSPIYVYLLLIINNMKKNTYVFWIIILIICILFLFYRYFIYENNFNKINIDKETINNWEIWTNSDDNDDNKKQESVIENILKNDNDNWILIWNTWLSYINETFWVQIVYWKERSWWKIFESKEMLNDSKIYELIKNIEYPIIVASMPSISKDDFEMVQLFEFLTYDEYEKLKTYCNNNFCDPRIDEITIWKNNKYFIIMHQWFSLQFEELSDLFYPYLPLEQVTIDDWTDDWRTFTGSKYIINNKFLFSDLKIFDLII